MAIHEPEGHSFLTRSFASLPSTGSRPAPETLLLELFREVFFKNRSGSARNKLLDPNEIRDGEQVFSKHERALLYMLMGRKRSRQTRQGDEKPFFAPAYPSLAENAWLGERRERMTYQFFLKGPLAQHLWQRGKTEGNKKKQKKLAKTLVEALSGNGNTKDSMYLSIPEGHFTCSERAEAIDRIEEKTESDSQLFKLLPLEYDEDELSSQIYQDLHSICALEKDIPRMQWIQIFMTFLRFSIPVWVLAQMKIIVILYEYIEKIYTGDIFPDQKEVITNILRRNKNLLTPSNDYNNELISNKIAKYMRCRVKLNILLEEIKKYNLIPDIENNKLTLLDSDDPDSIEIIDFLSQVRNTKDQFLKHLENTEYSSVENLISRRSEAYLAFSTPLSKGQGNNIKEFFQILYKGNIGEYFGGYLLSGKSGYLSGEAKVFPGPGLIKMMLFLALNKKRKENRYTNTKNLVLEDIETHFSKYGIDFTKTAETRKLLMASLKEMGLLTGSPDAGSSVAVASPFQRGRS